MSNILSAAFSLSYKIKRQKTVLRQEKNDPPHTSRFCHVLNIY